MGARYASICWWALNSRCTSAIRFPTKGAYWYSTMCYRVIAAERLESYGQEADSAGSAWLATEYEPLIQQAVPHEEETGHLLFVKLNG